MITYIIFFTSFVSLTAFCFQRNQILSALISIEATILAIAVLSLSAFSSALPFLIVLVFAVCEASIALALLVNMTRFSGSDNIILSNATWHLRSFWSLLCF